MTSCLIVSRAFSREPAAVLSRCAVADGHRPPLVLKRSCPKDFAFTKQQSYYNNAKPKNQVEKQNLYKSVCGRRDVGIVPYAQGRNFCVGRGALSAVIDGEGGLRMRRTSCRCGRYCRFCVRNLRSLQTFPFAGQRRWEYPRRFWLSYPREPRKGSG